MADVERDIDALYQGGLADFITARNALAKAATRPDLKTLEKPSLPAWAVNQIYWHERPVFDAVVRAAEAMREAHRQALAGKAADIRAAETAHRAAIRDAAKAATARITSAGHPATAATVDAVTRTLEALPSPEAAGRLTRPLAPAGLEALAGLTMAAPPARPALRMVSSRPAPAVVDDAAEKARAEAKAQAARERQARRDDAARAVEAAKTALLDAETAVGRAEDALAAAQAGREAARAALRQAMRALDAI